MSNDKDDETAKYIAQIKEGWSQLSAGLTEQVKKYTGGGDSGPSFVPTSMMGGSGGEDRNEHGRTAEQEASHQRKVKMNEEVQKVKSGGGTPSADDPLGLGK